MHLPIKYQLEGKMLGGMNVFGMGEGEGKAQKMKKS